METLLYDLHELAHELDASVEQMIRYGAAGDLTLYVIADEWPGKKADNSGAKSAVIADGPVELLPTDLLKALNSEYTEVRQVKTADGDVIELDSTQKVARGVHFVTAAERDRALEVLKPTVATSTDALPPYLDPAHQWYSEDLDAAVKAWSALYVDGGFKAKDRGHIKQIMDWLRQHYPGWTEFARKGVAKTVNPNKDGGNPKTRKN